MSCPFCGADARTQRRFQCWTLSDLTERSWTCMERENESLKARIARLEEAGDSLKEEARPTMFDCDETRKRCMDAIDAWDAARETKP